MGFISWVHGDARCCELQSFVLISFGYICTTRLYLGTYGILKRRAERRYFTRGTYVRRRQRYEGREINIIFLIRRNLDSVQFRNFLETKRSR